MSELKLVPPLAQGRKREVRVGHHVYNDDLHWLRDDERKSAEVLSLLEKENNYTLGVLKPTEGLRKTLYDEFVSHLQEDDEDPPCKHAGWLYFRRTVKGKNFPIYCRKRVSAPPHVTEGKREFSAVQAAVKAADEAEVLLDVNQLAAEGKHEFCSVKVKVSPNDERLAFLMDTVGNERYTLQIKDLSSNVLLPDKVGDVRDVDWSTPDVLYYSLMDAANRPHQLFRHRIGGLKDELVYEEKDQEYDMEFEVSLSGEYLFVNTNSRMTNEILFLPTSADRDLSGSTKLTIFSERRPDHLYSVDHSGDGHFYIVTNRNNKKNSELCRVPVERFDDAKSWETVLPHDWAKKIDDVQCLLTHVVVFGRKNGFTEVSILPNKGGKETVVAFPEMVFTCEIATNREFDAPAVRVLYESYITPQTVMDVNLATVTAKVVKEKPIPNYDRTKYSSGMMFANAKDGIRIPISYVFRKDKRDGQGPVYLVGYGSYGISYDPSFSTTRLSLLDRGVLVAYAHIRGGGEMGRLWYEAARLTTKKTTFTDFIAVAEHLIAEGHTTPKQLAIQGGSAGGMLMGAVLNMRPDLFGCCLTGVPFVDVLMTMSDPTLPLTVGEYDEWGNPGKEEFHEYIRSYSPMEQLRPQAYPPILATTALHDSRVGYWEPLKWIQRLRAIKTDQHPAMIRCEMTQGHSGSAARYVALQEHAFDLAFVLHHITQTKHSVISVGESNRTVDM